MPSFALTNTPHRRNDEPAGIMNLKFLRSLFGRDAATSNAVTAQAQSDQSTAAEFQRRTELVMSACHDMRQPLQAMSILSEALKMADLPTQHHKLALQMNQSVETLGGMLNQMLLMLQLDAPAFHPNIVEFSVGEVLGHLKNDLEPLAKAKGLELSIECSTAFVKSDHILLYRALSNLICNAISYTPQGQVGVSCEEGPATLRIEVSDTGIGIAEQDLPHVFEDFYRVNRAKSKCHLGLGLGNVRRIGSMMGWRVDVRSEVGKGTTFGIELDWPSR